MRRSALTLWAAVLCAFPAAARADQGDIIVQREPGLSGHERAELRHDAGVELVSTLPIAHTELVKPEDGDVSDALTALRADDAVVAAEPDTRVATAVGSERLLLDRAVGALERQRHRHRRPRGLGARRARVTG